MRVLNGRKMLWGVLFLGGTLLAGSFLMIRAIQQSSLRAFQNHALTLAGVLSRAAQNTLTSAGKVDELLADRLVANARLLEQVPHLDRDLLIQVAFLNGLYRIDLLSPDGTLRLSTAPAPRPLVEPSTLRKILPPEVDEGAFVLPGDPTLYAVAVRRPDGGITMVYADAGEIERIKRDIGIGTLVQDVGRQPGVVYLAFQTPQGVLYATPNVRELTRMAQDSALIRVMEEKQPLTRFYSFNGLRVLEAVAPFGTGDDSLSGVLRLGLSLEEYRQVVRAGQQQILIALLLLLAALAIALAYGGLLREVRAARSEAAEVFHNLPVGVVGLDPQGRVRVVNPAAEQMLGRSVPLGRPYEALFPEDPLGLRRCLTTGESQSREERIGDRRLRISALPLFSPDGGLSGAVALLEDITELARLQEEALRARELQALGLLLGGVAHEVRNPLNAISLLAQKVKQVARSGEEKKLAENLQEAVRRLDRTVQQFLTLAAPYRRKRVLTDLRELIERIRPSLELEAEGKGVRLQFHLSALPPAWVDPDGMESMLVNLVRNAVEATSKGGTVQVHLAQAGDRLRVEVRDQGPGIPPQELDRIFLPYYTTKPGGRGLGLSVVRRVVEAHGGEIRVESAPGKGTCFEVWIPLDSSERAKGHGEDPDRGR